MMVDMAVHIVVAFLLFIIIRTAEITLSIEHTSVKYNNTSDSDGCPVIISIRKMTAGSVNNIVGFIQALWCFILVSNQ